MAISAPYLGKSGKVTLDDEIFGEDFHMALVHEVAKAELNAKRQGTASTLTRGQVAMTGAKAFRQKGTGRARAGALSTPQRVGGGVAFGPKPRHFINKVNRKARRRAMRAVLSLHAGRGTLAVLDPSDFDAPGTKQAAGALEKFKAGRALVALSPEGEEAAAKSFRNLPKVDVLPVDSIGVSDIVGAARLIVSEPAIERLKALAAAPARGADKEDEAA